jgi:peptidoglycan/xylan/chitin deacetylase (PgdA/CDA1 family)
MQFCVRDDDTSFFTSPDELESAYGAISRYGPISLAVVPFHRAGTSKGVPEKFRGRWSVHPLSDNRGLVDYLRRGAAEGRYEVMLHGYYHDEPDGHREFERGDDLATRVADGRKYLEDLLETRIRMFVPPRNAIGRSGLSAIADARLHLGGVAGMRAGWSKGSSRSWATWVRLRRWRRRGGAGVPWVLDLGDHREIAGNAVTPVSQTAVNAARFSEALAVNGAFCLATHYWELSSPSLIANEPPVGEQLQHLIERAAADPRVRWRSVGDVTCDASWGTR